MSQFRNIEIAGTTYALRYDHNAIADIEERTGMGFRRMLGLDMEFHGCRLMLWAGLKHKLRTLTVGQAGDLVQAYINQFPDENGLELLSTECFKAMQQAGLFKEAEKDEKNEKGGEGADPQTATA